MQASRYKDEKCHLKGKVFVYVLVRVQCRRPGRAELLNGLAVLLDDRRGEVQEVGDLQQLCVAVLGRYYLQTITTLSRWNYIMAIVDK